MGSGISGPTTTHPGAQCVMTNQIAIFLFLFLLALLGIDVVFNDSAVFLLLAKKLFELIEWLAFWR
jgi:hypothetical protein